MQLPSWREPPSCERESAHCSMVAPASKHPSSGKYYCCCPMVGFFCKRDSIGYLCTLSCKLLQDLWQKILAKSTARSVPCSDLSPTINKISKNIGVKAFYICGEDQGCYNNDMSKHASLYELSTPLTTLDSTKGEKNSSSSHVRG